MQSTPPFFSIIIPTYNRAASLRTCLASLVCLNYPPERFEVIVVDDGSLASLQPLVNCFTHQLSITLLSQAHAGPATARNTGAACATGTFLAFTDDDCCPAPGWLQALAACFTKAPDCLVGGKTVNALPTNPYAAASQHLIEYIYAFYNADPQQAGFFAANNIAVPAEQFRSLGGFDPRFHRAAAEDRELCDRWRHHGSRFAYGPEAVVYHQHQLTFQTFWQQHYSYGQGAFRFHALRARRGWGRLRPDPCFYLPLLWRPLLRQRSAGLWLTSLLSLAQVANTVGFLHEAARHSFSRGYQSFCLKLSQTSALRHHE